MIHFEGATEAPVRRSTVWRMVLGPSPAEPRHRHDRTVAATSTTEAMRRLFALRVPVHRRSADENFGTIAREEERVRIVITRPRRHGCQCKDGCLASGGSTVGDVHRPVEYTPSRADGRGVLAIRLYVAGGAGDDYFE